MKLFKESGTLYYYIGEKGDFEKWQILLIRKL